jgi:hypothetical protein
VTANTIKGAYRVIAKRWRSEFIVILDELDSVSNHDPVEKHGFPRGRPTVAYVIRIVIGS